MSYGQIFLYGDRGSNNTARPHQGIAQHVPGSDRHIPRAAVTGRGIARIHRRPVLGGLINEYTHAA